jgi:PAP2 superfamily
MLQWLAWQDSSGLAGATAASWAATNHSTRKWARRLVPWCRELTITLVLYTMWQYAGAWSIGRLTAATTRGRDIWDLERWLHLPSEQSAQQVVLHHHTLVRWLNEYYVQVHVPALGACLLWLFIRHRDRYPNVRNVVAVVTGACLLIQLFPVAPPRLLPHLGIVDTGAVIGPSDYSGGAPGIDQLSAMPSLHVAWALIVAGAMVWVSRRRYRWLTLLYPATTAWVVVVTGNHYWADGAVAAALYVLAALIVTRITARSFPVPTRTLSRAHGGPQPDDPKPVPL